MFFQQIHRSANAFAQTAYSLHMSMSKFSKIHRLYLRTVDYADTQAELALSFSHLSPGTLSMTSFRFNNLLLHVFD